VFHRDAAGEAALLSTCFPGLYAISWKFPLRLSRNLSAASAKCGDLCVTLVQRQRPSRKTPRSRRKTISLVGARGDRPPFRRVCFLRQCASDGRKASRLPFLSWNRTEEDKFPSHSIYCWTWDKIGRRRPL